MPNRLASYIDSIRARDPAPHSRLEILTYPGVWALAGHRIAHRLYKARFFLLARIVNHWTRAWTAIDIHPGAKIGRNFFIDHGFVVIGETAEIGDDVTIYQCVTLGGTSPDNGVAGKRHPTVMNGAIIGSGAQVLGPITLGPRSRVGANAVVTRDVPEGAVMVGIPARPTMVEGGQQTPRFVPYGTPCSENFDPVTQRTELLRCEVEQLRRRLDALLADQQGEGERDRA
ncbi:serine O-acetyltransferase [Sphingomonas sp. SORGH_AS802]|jgi:serine O-acetyltransferase|uniref:serine O-acetyltransferase EpsC n=1 Tax=unclassified Sphingomonas TaxID=196159 RepID=UPI000F7EBFDD|nr:MULTISPECIES: serine O-acetyltransferase EpsC [unclassified Sphingomonas]MDR6127365.1 serine O-acetyltransferase [Sphingomonas sp. SORGH_AS_0438]MDR6133718.1 serine O-acetyltransferase [Sphingomonas sp. SORGH_AS_0802]RSU54370.1 serine acetyltransferase [Sphingomonas sp. S-NIH.Pt15_0812]